MNTDEPTDDLMRRARNFAGTTAGKATLAAAALAVLIGIGNATDDPDTEPAAAPSVTETVTEPAAAPSVTETVTDEPTSDPPAPEPEPADDSGDYASRQVYVEELIDSSDKLAEIMGLIAEAADAYGSGDFTAGQFVTLMDKAEESVDSHRSFFAGRTAPDGFGDADALFKDAIDSLLAAIDSARTCARDDNLSACGHMEDVSSTMNAATAALPTP